jgi:hypothetical protein
MSGTLGFEPVNLAGQSPGVKSRPQVSPHPQICRMADLLLRECFDAPRWFECCRVPRDDKECSIAGKVDTQNEGGMIAIRQLRHRDFRLTVRTGAA